MATEEPTKGPPTGASLEVSWNFLKTGVDRIMSQLENGMSYTYYMLLYTACYNYCISNKLNEVSLPAGSYGAGMGSSGAVKAGAHLMGSDLYNKLSEYLKGHLTGLRQESDTLSDLALLQFYVKSWNRYTTGANYVNRLFAYLNRHWVKREKDEGRKGIYQVYTLALVKWKEHFFLAMNRPEGNRLIQALLAQIETHRKGEEVDGSTIKAVIDSMVALGLEEEQLYGHKDNKATIEVYREHFQKPFLSSTEAFYRSESEKFLAENSISDYLKLAERRLEEEERRVDLWMHSQTKQPLLTRAEAVLVTEHKAKMQEEFGPLLDADRQEDLARMWKLLYRVQQLEPLRMTFEAHVEQSGKENVTRAMEGTAKVEGKAESINTKSYVAALLEVYKKNLIIVEKPFEGDTGFQGALDKACVKFVNVNPAAATGGKSSEFLVNYIDGLLRKSNKETSGQTMDEALDDAMTLFKYLSDRDVFQTFYSKALSDRLLRDSSASEEAEGSMISKLKDICGIEYTSKLQKMLTDVNLSKELTEKFKEKMNNSGHEDKIDFSIIVGGAVNWPNGNKPTEYSIPREIQPLFDRFKGYYNNFYSGRQLTWLWRHGRCDVQMTFTKPKITLSVSASQMAILLLFNNEESMTFKEIQEHTKIEPAYLKGVMKIFVKSKVLLVQDGDTYDLNRKFKSQKVRLNLNLPIKSEQEKESTELHASVVEERVFIYSATIVRIMKSRKTMKHTLLINEVISQVDKLFTPEISSIKKSIEELVDKEYLERDADAKDVYNYLA